MFIAPSWGLNSCGKLASGWKAIQLVGIVSLPSFLRRIPWRSTILTKGCDVWEAPSPTGENTIVVISYHIYSQHEAMLGHLVLFSYCWLFLRGLATSKSGALRCWFTGISLHDLGTEREGVEPWYLVHVSGWATSQCLNLWLANLPPQLTSPQIEGLMKTPYFWRGCSFSAG